MWFIWDNAVTSDGQKLSVAWRNQALRPGVRGAAADRDLDAIIIEEYGLLIGFLLLFLYMILLYRGVKIMRDNNKPFGGLVAIGLSFSLVFQALVNMAVAVNLFPVTRQPLPLISMGGTPIWFTMIALGIILSVSRGVEDKEEERLETT